jgi:hypothetical protein
LNSAFSQTSFKLQGGVGLPWTLTCAWLSCQPRKARAAKPIKATVKTVILPDFDIKTSFKSGLIANILLPKLIVNSLSPLVASCRILSYLVVFLIEYFDVGLLQQNAGKRAILGLKIGFF